MIAGSEDGSTPPDLVRETAELIRGSRFALLRRTGHLPPVDRPDAFAATLATFLHEIGHVGTATDAAHDRVGGRLRRNRMSRTHART